MSQKRYPVLLNMGYPPERRVHDAVRAMDEGERAAFVRALIFLGHQEMQTERSPEAEEEQMQNGTRGTN